MILLGLFASAQWPSIHYWWWVVAAVIVVTSSTCVRCAGLPGSPRCCCCLAGGDRVVHRRRRAHPQRRDGRAPSFNEADLQRCQLPLEPAVRRHGGSLLLLPRFDAISTLAEETKRPARAVSIATVSSLLLITGLFLVQVYFSRCCTKREQADEPEHRLLQIFGVAGGSTCQRAHVALNSACSQRHCSLGGASGCSTGWGGTG